MTEIQKPLAACTIVSRNYLSHARTVARSFLEQERGGRFYVLIVDRLPEGVEFGGAAQVIDPTELGYDNWTELTFQYNPTELCTAVKPRLLARLMEQYGEEQVVYIDPDILVLSPFDALKPVLAEASLVLTPHMLTPLPLDGLLPGEQDILISGAYNLGFLALNRSAQTREFLEWWDTRLLRDCRVDVSHGLFVDQKWVDLVPGYFDGTRLLRDETYNIAFWNLHERALELRDGVFYVNGKPITFYHFSGFDAGHPEILSKHQTRTSIPDNPALAELVRCYTARHMEHGYETFIRLPYGYGQFDNGIRIHPLLRRLYGGLDDAERAQFGNPFETRRENSFLSWATVAGQRDSGMSPFLELLYLYRFELAWTFAETWPEERSGFVKWAEHTGARAMGFDPQLVRGVKPGDTSAEPREAASAEPPNDLFDGTFPPEGQPTLAQLREMWLKERSYRALQRWAQEMERSLQQKDRALALYKYGLGEPQSPRHRLARWVNAKLNRKES